MRPWKPPVTTDQDCRDVRRGIVLRHWHCSPPNRHLAAIDDTIKYSNLGPRDSLDVSAVSG